MMSETTRKSKFRRTKGRTGWPEAVWAEALESGSKMVDSNGPIIEENERLDGLSYPTAPPLISMLYDTSDQPVSDKMEMFGGEGGNNQGYFENKEALPMFVVANDKGGDYLKNYSLNIDYVVTQPETQTTKELNYPSNSSTSTSEDASCSSSPDVFHSSAVSFPVLSPEIYVEPLPSITTLRSCRKDWCENSAYTEIPNIDLGSITSDIIDFSFQNGRLDDEPSFVELQPVNRLSRKCPEIM